MEITKANVRRRLEFIEFQLNWQGRVGRPELQNQFGISPQQATIDLGDYGKLAPGNIAYDPKEKAYVRTPMFKPELTRGDVVDYLTQLEMMASGYRTSDEIWPVTIPQYETVTIRSRPIDPNTFRNMLTAINEKKPVTIRYVSLSSVSDEARLIAPLALASDGHRWHVRAYDCDKRRHSDFVLSRIDEAEISKEHDGNTPDDNNWLNFAELRLKPAKGLSDRQREQLELEYGMDSGQFILKVRKAMLFYYLRNYGFDPLALVDGVMRNTSSFRLEIANPDDIEEALGRRN